MTVIVTHPERNPILREDPQRIAEWAEQGCVIQMTGSALTGFWGERSRRVAHWLLENRAVHVLSDSATILTKRVPDPLDSTRCRGRNLQKKLQKPSQSPTRAPF